MLLLFNLPSGLGAAICRGGWASLHVLIHYCSQLLSCEPTAQVESDAAAAVQHWALVKGAPEVVRGFLRRVPDDYDATYRAFAAQGGRCASLGFRFSAGRTGERGCVLSGGAGSSLRRVQVAAAPRATGLPCRAAGVPRLLSGGGAGFVTSPTLLHASHNCLQCYQHCPCWRVASTASACVFTAPCHAER